MDRSEVITLLAPTQTQDTTGVWRTSYTETDVYCQVDSVTQQEFFEGGRNGLNPSYRFTVFFGDYAGQPLVQYNGSTYSIYRTYMGRNDTLELYAERKGGTNGRSA